MLLIIVASLFKLGSVASGIKCIISDLTKEINNSNKPLSLSEKSRNVYKCLLVIDNTFKNGLLSLISRP
jgi:hypothetical protein